MYAHMHIYGERLCYYERLHFISVPLCILEDISEEYKPRKRIAGPYDYTNLYSFQQSINSSYSTVLVTLDFVRL